MTNRKWDPIGRTWTGPCRGCGIIFTTTKRNKLFHDIPCQQKDAHKRYRAKHPFTYRPANTDHMSKEINKASDQPRHKIVPYKTYMRENPLYFCMVAGVDFSEVALNKLVRELKI